MPNPVVSYLYALVKESRTDHMVKFGIPVDKITDRTKGSAKDVMGGADSTSDGRPLLSDKENARVADMLDPDEAVVMSTRQGRVTGVRVVTPAAIFVTERRVILRKPKRIGLGEDIEKYRYDDITNVRFEKGITSSKILLDFPGGVSTFKGKDDYYEKGSIGGLSKKDAKQICQYIHQRIKDTKESASKVEVVGATAAAEDPITVLKKRFASGEITAEEYATAKKILEE